MMEYVSCFKSLYTEYLAIGRCHHEEVNALVTHLLVSSNWWIFLCSSRLLALHADILQKDKEQSRQREWNRNETRQKTVWNNTVLARCIISPSFPSLPISACWVLSRTTFCPSTRPLLSFMFHLSHNESPSIVTELDHHWNWCLINKLCLHPI